MKMRIKYMYENGNASLLEMLFSAKNMTDFLNKADFIENLSDYDRQALTQLQDIHQEIADQKEDLENQQASMQSLSEQLKSKQTELQAKAVATSTDLDTVNAKLKKAKEEEAARLAEEARQRAAAEAAAKKNSTSRSKRFATVSTDVTWGVKIVLWIMVVFRISIGKKYAARITVIIKQFLNHLFSRHRERNPNSDNTIPTAGRI